MTCDSVRRVTATLTRAARRDATRAALLDATIASLAEVGYAATTTRGVAERAGVSQGAQQHYYPTKAQLVDAAITRLAEQVAAAIIANPPAGKTDRERLAALVDRLWELHNDPLAATVYEFLNAARTDPDIAAAVADLLDHVADIAEQIAASVVPGLATGPRARDWLLITMATMRGAALVSSVPGTERALPDWPALRAHILRSAQV